MRGQSDYPRSVVNLEQIVDAPNDEDVRTLFESARDEALVVAGILRSTANLRFFSLGLVNNATCVDCSHDSWMSQLGVALLIPPAEVSLEREASVHVSTQSTLPSARVFNVDVFSWVVDELVCDILGRVVETSSSLHMFRMATCFPGVDMACSHFELATLHHEFAVDPLHMVFRLRDGDGLAFLGCRLPWRVAAADPDLVHHWEVRPIEVLGCLRSPMVEVFETDQEQC